MACPLSSCLATMARKTCWLGCSPLSRATSRCLQVLSYSSLDSYKAPKPCLAPRNQGGFWLNVRSLLQNGILGFREGVGQGTSTPTTGWMWASGRFPPQRRGYRLPGSGGGATRPSSEHETKEPETTRVGELLDTLGILSQSRGLEMGLHGPSFSGPWGHK